MLKMLQALRLILAKRAPRTHEHEPSLPRSQIFIVFEQCLKHSTMMLLVVEENLSSLMSNVSHCCGCISPKFDSFIKFDSQNLI